MKFECPCGYIYDPELGDPDGGIAPGTAWEDIPEDWVCPVCGLGKDAFVGAEKRPEDGDYDTALTGDITPIASGPEIAAGSRVPVGMIVNTGVYGAIEDEEE